MTMAVTLTESAAKQVRSYLEKDEVKIGLRFGVRTSGCSGFAYVVELVDSVDESDQVFESNGVKVVVDGESLPLVLGTEIDYTRGNLSEAFVFDNPNVAASCGCGESFTTTH